MNAPLYVRFAHQLVGTVRGDDSGRLCFTYDGAWLTHEQAFAISLSLPLRGEEYVSGPAHAFFTNLLPEGAVRQAVCNRLGISEGNDLGLLRAIGGECAGALSVGDREVSDRDHEYEELEGARLQALVGQDVVPLLVGGPTTRLSLAGAQDKLPVTVLDGRVHLPLHGSPSTHILKLPNPRFAHLPDNEAFVMGLARQLGLDVASCELLTRTEPRSLLVERYDRKRRDDHDIERWHQEDLCQALGLSPALKYEQEGGPTLVQIIEVVRDHVRQPLTDVRRLIEWQAFDVLVGNADGHGKNLSLLYTSAREIELASFYDLVSTREYDRLTPLLAMSVGGRRNPDEIGREQWARLARDAGLTPRVVTDMVGDLVERSLVHLAGWTADFKDRYGDSPILQTLPKRIRKQAERMARLLA